MQWLAQNWPWVVIAVVAGLFLLDRARRYRFDGLGAEGGHGHRSRHGSPVPEDAQGHGHASTTIDPVSGKPVNTDRALTTYHGGRVYFFENDANRRRFEAAPDRFARNAKAAGSASSTPSTHRAHRRHGC